MFERVLIVDDEENIREMSRLALEASGYEVGEAGTVWRRSRSLALMNRGTPEAISAVEKVLNGLPLETTFWTDQAEQFLSDFCGTTEMLQQPAD